MRIGGASRVVSVLRLERFQDIQSKPRRAYMTHLRRPYTVKPLRKDGGDRKKRWVKPSSGVAQVTQRLDIFKEVRELVSLTAAVIQLVKVIIVSVRGF